MLLWRAEYPQNSWVLLCFPATIGEMNNNKTKQYQQQNNIIGYQLMTLFKYTNVKLSVILSVLAMRGRGFSVICTGWKTSILFIWRCACVTQQWLCHGWFIVVAVGSKQKSVSFHATIPDQFCIIHVLLGINTHFRLIHSLYLTQAQIFGPCPPSTTRVSPTAAGKTINTHTFSPESCCARPAARCLVDRLPASGAVPSSGPKALLLRLTGTVQTSSLPANQLVSHPACLPSSRHISPQQAWQRQALTTFVAGR